MTTCEVVVFFVGKFYNIVMACHGVSMAMFSYVTVEAYGS